MFFAVNDACSRPAAALLADADGAGPRGETAAGDVAPLRCSNAQSSSLPLSPE